MPDEGSVVKPSLLLCRLGSHYELPVALNKREPHVLLKCERCGRHRTLLGREAQQWIDRFMAGGT